MKVQGNRYINNPEMIKNKVEKHYDKFCERYNGNKYFLKDAIRDRNGNYHDDIIYEIVNE